MGWGTLAASSTGRASGVGWGSLAGGLGGGGVGHVSEVVKGGLPNGREVLDRRVTEVESDKGRDMARERVMVESGAGQDDDRKGGRDKATEGDQEKESRAEKEREGEGAFADGEEAMCIETPTETASAHFVSMAWQGAASQTFAAGAAGGGDAGLVGAAASSCLTNGVGTVALDAAAGAEPTAQPYADAPALHADADATAGRLGGWGGVGLVSTTHIGMAHPKSVPSPYAMHAGHPGLHTGAPGMHYIQPAAPSWRMRPVETHGPGMQASNLVQFMHQRHAQSQMLQSARSHAGIPLPHVRMASMPAHQGAPGSHVPPASSLEAFLAGAPGLAPHNMSRMPQTQSPVPAVAPTFASSTLISAAPLEGNVGNQTSAMVAATGGGTGAVGGATGAAGGLNGDRTSVALPSCDMKSAVPSLDTSSSEQSTSQLLGQGSGRPGHGSLHVSPRKRPLLSSPKLVVPAGWKMVTSNSTGKVYWYNKTTGKSTWEPPPGSLFSSAEGNDRGSGEDDGLPTQPTNFDPVSDSEGAVVPYEFSKPSRGGRWLAMRDAEAAASAGRSSQRILLCSFDVDDVGLVIEPKGLDSSSMLHKFKVLTGYGSATDGLLEEVITIQVLAQILGPAIYFWTRALSMTSADIKKEWTDASLRGGDAALADKRGVIALDLEIGGGGDDKRRKVKSIWSGRAGGESEETLKAPGVEEAQNNGGKRPRVASDSDSDADNAVTSEKKAKSNAQDAKKGGFSGIKIPRKGESVLIPKKEGGLLPRIPKKGEAPAVGTSSQRIGVVGARDMAVVASPQSPAAPHGVSAPSGAGASQEKDTKQRVAGGVGASAATPDFVSHMDKMRGDKDTESKRKEDRVERGGREESGGAVPGGRYTHMNAKFSKGVKMETTNGYMARFVGKELAVEHGRSGFARMASLPETFSSNACSSIYADETEVEDLKEKGADNLRKTAKADEKAKTDAKDKGRDKENDKQRAKEKDRDTDAQMGIEVASGEVSAAGFHVKAAGDRSREDTPRTPLSHATSGDISSSDDDMPLASKFPAAGAAAVYPQTHTHCVCVCQCALAYIFTYTHTRAHKHPHTCTHTHAQIHPLGGSSSDPTTALLGQKGQGPRATLQSERQRKRQRHTQWRGVSVR